MAIRPNFSINPAAMGGVAFSAGLGDYRQQQQQLALQVEQMRQRERMFEKDILENRRNQAVGIALDDRNRAREFQEQLQLYQTKLADTKAIERRRELADAQSRQAEEQQARLEVHGELQQAFGEIAPESLNKTGQDKYNRIMSEYQQIEDSLQNGKIYPRDAQYAYQQLMGRMKSLQSEVFKAPPTRTIQQMMEEGVDMMPYQNGVIVRQPDGKTDFIKTHDQPKEQVQKPTSWQHRDPRTGQVVEDQAGDTWDTGADIVRRNADGSLESLFNRYEASQSILESLMEEVAEARTAEAYMVEEPEIDEATGMYPPGSQSRIIDNRPDWMSSGQSIYPGPSDPAFEMEMQRRMNALLNTAKTQAGMTQPMQQPMQNPQQMQTQQQAPQAEPQVWPQYQNVGASPAMAMNGTPYPWSIADVDALPSVDNDGELLSPDSFDFAFPPIDTPQQKAFIDQQLSEISAKYQSDTAPLALPPATVAYLAALYESLEELAQKVGAKPE